MSQAPESVINALVASGFPFQTAVASLVPAVEGWTIVAEEFPWRDDTGADEFLDIVATNGTSTVAVECKKTQKETFTFLRPGGGSERVARARCLYLTQIQDSTRRMEVFCSDWWLAPPSSESAFCVVSTSESRKDQRLLERDAQRLIRGTDGYALHYRRTFQRRRDAEPDRPIVAVLVTNAKLFLARYETAAVSLDTGQFAMSPDADISPVQWVRFRKPFASSGGHDLGDRTVFIVLATAFAEFLAWIIRQEAETSGKAG